MKIKDSYKISGHEYTVQFKDMDENFGKCDLEKCIIYIDENLTQSQKEETLFHEAIHAMRNTLGIAVKDTDDEEILVQGMGNSLYQFLKDNAIIN